MMMSVPIPMYMSASVPAAPVEARLAAVLGTCGRSSAVVARARICALDPLAVAWCRGVAPSITSAKSSRATSKPAPQRTRSCSPSRVADAVVAVAAADHVALEVARSGHVRAR